MRTWAIWPGAVISVLAACACAAAQGASTSPASTRAASAPATTVPATATTATAAGAERHSKDEEAATASVPVEKVVAWHRQYARAMEEARQRNVPLLVVFYEPDAPAWERFERESLQDLSMRKFLTQFCAVQLDVRSPEGAAKFASAGGKDVPLSLVYSPDAELLERLPGAIIPASSLRESLQRVLNYYSSATTKPFDNAAAWKAVQARLLLASREKALPEINRLLELPAEKLPAGLSPMHLHLARGEAMMISDPKAAKEELELVAKGSPGTETAGRAMLDLSQLALREKDYAKAHQLAGQYISAYPKGADIGKAHIQKALLEMTSLDDRPAAQKTLKEFIQKYPDDPVVVKAKDLLESLEKIKGK
jgi:tetratricopeptide (TPR) repeat protein